MVRRSSKRSRLLTVMGSLTTMMKSPQKFLINSCTGRARVAMQRLLEKDLFLETDLACPQLPWKFHILVKETAWRSNEKMRSHHTLTDNRGRICIRAVTACGETLERWVETITTKSALVERSVL